MKAAAILIAAPMLAVSPVAAPAQSVFELVAGIKFCRTLTDDAQRLKCFDSIGVEKPKGEASDQSATETTWAVEENKSPVDDSPQVTATLFNPNRAGLTLRCKDHKTEALFAKLGSYLGDSVKVLVRINDAKPIEAQWLSSVGGQAAFAPAAIQFIRSLPDNSKLFIRATGWAGGTADAEFMLGNVSEVREKIATACKWPGGSGQKSN